MRILCVMMVLNMLGSVRTLAQRLPPTPLPTLKVINTFLTKYIQLSYLPCIQ